MTEKGAAHPADNLKPLTVTVNRAAELTGLGVSTIWMLIAQGKLETTTFGRRRLIRFDSIERLLAGGKA